MSLSIEFFGHACFGLFFDDGPTICVDPYAPELFPDFNRLTAIDEEFDYVISTHAHADHSSFDQVEPSARLYSPSCVGGVTITHHEVFHDEYGGRLRGGTTRMTSFRRDGIHVLHAGDIGERITAVQQRTFDLGTIDVLIVPVGGYYTLGPDGAFDLTTQLSPRWVVPCHAREHGIALPRLGDAHSFIERFPSRRHESATQSRWQRRASSGSEPFLLHLTPSRLK